MVALTTASTAVEIDVAVAVAVLLLVQGSELAGDGWFHWVMVDGARSYWSSLHLTMVVVLLL